MSMIITFTKFNCALNLPWLYLTWSRWLQYQPFTSSFPLTRGILLYPLNSYSCFKGKFKCHLACEAFLNSQSKIKLLMPSVYFHFPIIELTVWDSFIYSTNICWVITRWHPYSRPCGIYPWLISQLLICESFSKQPASTKELRGAKPLLHSLA